eukprot:282203-Chlamydomonas_euryale.AAC.1
MLPRRPQEYDPRSSGGGGGGSDPPGDAEFVAAVRVHGRDFRALSRVLNMRRSNAAKHWFYKWVRGDG